MESAHTNSGDHDMETLGSHSFKVLLILYFFVEVWLDETSNKLLEISLLYEQSTECQDETLQRVADIKQDYHDRGFARLSIQGKMERSRAKRPFTSSEQGSLREKHDTVLHLVEVVTRSLQQKLGSRQTRPTMVKYFESPVPTSMVLINRRHQV